MIKLGKLLGLGKKAAEPATAPAVAKTFKSPRDFTVSAAELMTDQASLEEAFATAVGKAEAGEPYGVALFFAVRGVARNSQFVDEMIDELPNWAFGDRPSDHFAFMVHNWARATESGEKEQHTAFKTFAILGGWRPGDANAYWLDYRVGVTPALPPMLNDPLGRDHMDEQIRISGSEMRVYAHLSLQAEKLAETVGHA
jgi:hypothetical protein